MTESDYPLSPCLSVTVSTSNLSLCLFLELFGSENWCDVRRKTRPDTFQIHHLFPSRPPVLFSSGGLTHESTGTSSEPVPVDTVGPGLSVEVSSWDLSPTVVSLSKVQPTNPQTAHGTIRSIRERTRMDMTDMTHLKEV